LFTWTQEDILKEVCNTIDFHRRKKKYYGNQWCPRTVQFPAFFKISSFVFNRTTQGWVNDDTIFILGKFFHFQPIIYLKADNYRNEKFQTSLKIFQIILNKWFIQHMLFSALYMPYGTIMPYKKFFIGYLEVITCISMMRRNLKRFITFIYSPLTHQFDTVKVAWCCTITNSKARSEMIVCSFIYCWLDWHIHSFNEVKKRLTYGKDKQLSNENEQSCHKNDYYYFIFFRNS